MDIVCISDTHGHHNELKLSKGDLLIHAGDMDIDTEDKFYKFIDWFGKQPFDYKVLVAGNHDFFLEKKSNYWVRQECYAQEICYLSHNAVSINGLNIFGSPYTPRYGRWAFMKERGLELDELWKQIPNDTDILVTHGPPLNILDEVHLVYGSHNVGCWDLDKKVKEVKPKYHIFGHIHSCYGGSVENNINYINCSVVDENYDLVHPPIRFEI